MTKQWRFWVDRGGTFTDVIALTPNNTIKTTKLLSDNPSCYADAVVAGIRRMMALDEHVEIPSGRIRCVHVGTTVATNALLQRKGAKTALVTSRGFKDCLAIAYQQRPDLFSLNIEKPDKLYAVAVETSQRRSVDGDKLSDFDEKAFANQLKQLKRDGIVSIAIAFLHATSNPKDELCAQRLARSHGFNQVVCSHQVINRVGLIARGQTTVIEAYLSPVLCCYMDYLHEFLPGVEIQMMQSNGGLVDSAHFKAKDSLLSGPAGGVVACQWLARQCKLSSVIGFDMGGTSTDIAYYDGELYRRDETTVAGVPFAQSILDITTIAAGGGSVLRFSQGRFIVGPESAGANPGPACYGKGGPLTITDCHVLLGNITEKDFPCCFGQSGRDSINKKRVVILFEKLCQEVNRTLVECIKPNQLANRFIHVAVSQMAAAIKRVMLKHGRDGQDTSLICFGGAGGQHACGVAKELGIQHVVISPYASVFSALGIGLADQRVLRERAIEKPFDEFCNWLNVYQELEREIGQQFNDSNVVDYHRQIYLKYIGNNHAMAVPWSSDCCSKYRKKFLNQFGFDQPGTPIVCQSLSVEGVIKQYASASAIDKAVRRYARGAGSSYAGPTRLIEQDTVIVIDEGWFAEVDSHNNLQVIWRGESKQQKINSHQADPMWLEIFNHSFMSIAEQMGEVLIRAARSVNIKERRDFSCALFDMRGDLIANAPHMPVHLGSMGDSVKAIISHFGDSIQSGDAYLLNDPYSGGTHLPDLTVITPMFINDNDQVQFFLACRGHHADIGGIEPGSMPAHSTHIDQEGVVFRYFKCVDQQQFQYEQILKKLKSLPFPARNADNNIADIQAQLAANQCGVQLLKKLVDRYGLTVVNAYVEFVNDNARNAVSNALKKIKPAHFRQLMDCGAVIDVDLTWSKGQCLIDLGQSCGAQGSNFHAPTSVSIAAVLYVLRCLIAESIPLNQGCLMPIQIVLPVGGLLNPHTPEAVVAGNVETSQNIVEALLSALGLAAQSQGTMNNITFGNDQVQYYETLAGGSGAGPGFNGADAVQVHMTNTRLTDPEILEHYFPVRLIEFSIRCGSGGRGKTQGGNGVIRVLEFQQAMHVNVLSEHRVYAPQGLCGGEAGLVGVNRCVRRGGEVVELEACASITVEPGDRLCIETPGGGGYGQFDGSFER